MNELSELIDYNTKRRKKKVASYERGFDSVQPAYSNTRNSHDKEFEGILHLADISLVCGDGDRRSDRWLFDLADYSTVHQVSTTHA